MMKEREQKRVQKTVDSLAKIAKALQEDKAKAALRSVLSLHKKLGEKLAKSKKGGVKKVKKALTGFPLFVKQHSAKARAENPKLSQPEIMKLLSKMYKAEKKGDKVVAAKKAVKSMKVKKAKKAVKKIVGGAKPAKKVVKKADGKKVKKAKKSAKKM